MRHNNHSLTPNLQRRAGAVLRPAPLPLLLPPHPAGGLQSRLPRSLLQPQVTGAGAGVRWVCHTMTPREPRLVVTSNDKHGVGLWDVRMPDRCVLQYGSLGGRQQVEGSRYIYTSVSLPVPVPAPAVVNPRPVCTPAGTARGTRSWGSGGDCLLYSTGTGYIVYTVQCLVCTLLSVWCVQCTVLTVNSLRTEKGYFKTKGSL